MKKSFLSFLAIAAAALLPIAAAAQIAPDRPPKTTDEPTYKWKAYAGVGYTSLNQVNQSRYGLIGVTAAATRDWGRYFGLTVQGSHYMHATSSGNLANYTVSEVLVGPELHVPLFDKWNGFGHVLVGGEHTGGGNQTPNISFAGGGGGGLEYQMTPHVGVRIFGDAILASFSVVNGNAQNGFSAHTTRNPQASIGVTYRF